MEITRLRNSYMNVILKHNQTYCLVIQFRGPDKLEFLNFQLNFGEKDNFTKPVFINTLCWPRSGVVAIPDKLWEGLSSEEKSPTREQTSKEGKTFGKRSI